MAAPAVVPAAGSFSGTSNGISDPWMYDQVPNALQTGVRVVEHGPNGNDPNYQTEVGLRGHSMRTPAQRQQNFAQESMMSELAAAAGVDPIQFRINNTTAERLITVLNAAKDASGWVTRPSPSPNASTTGSKPFGRARAAARCCGPLAYWACVAQVSIVPKTGKITVTNVTTAVDPGLVANPFQLKRMSEGGTVMGVSETLHEQVGLQQGGNHRPRLGHVPDPSDHGAAEDQDRDHQQPERRCHRLGRRRAERLRCGAIANAVFDATEGSQGVFR